MEYSLIIEFLHHQSLSIAIIPRLIMWFIDDSGRVRFWELFCLLGRTYTFQWVSITTSYREHRHLTHSTPLRPITALNIHDGLLTPCGHLDKFHRVWPICRTFRTPTRLRYLGYFPNLLLTSASVVTRGCHSGQRFPIVKRHKLFIIEFHYRAI